MKKLKKGRYRRALLKRMRRAIMAALVADRAAQSALLTGAMRHAVIVGLQERNMRH